MNMPEAERTRADAETLLDSLRRDWQDLASRPMSDMERKGVFQHMQWAFEELENLFATLEKPVISRAGAE
jgi:flagellar hook-associated protein FlgK